MPSNIGDTLANGILDYISSQLDGGDIRFETSGAAEVATVGLNADSFPAASSKSMSANTMTDDTSAAGGLVDHALVRDSSTNTEFQCTCGAGSGEFDFNSLTVGVGDTVSVTSFTITHS